MKMLFENVPPVLYLVCGALWLLAAVVNAVDKRPMASIAVWAVVGAVSCSVGVILIIRERKRRRK